MIESFKIAKGLCVEIVLSTKVKSELLVLKSPAWEFSDPVPLLAGHHLTLNNNKNKSHGYLYSFG